MFLAKGVWQRALLIAVLAAASSVVCLESIDWLGHRELQTHQWWLLRTPLPPDPRIVLISIERDTPEKLGASTRNLPLPRRYHALLIQSLRAAGARSLLMDLLFTARSAQEEDEPLRQALASSAPLSVTLATEELSAEPAPQEPGGFLYSFAPLAVLPKPLPSGVTVASAKAFDPGLRLDGAVLLLNDHLTGRMIPHLAFSGVLGYLGIDYAAARAEPGYVRAGGHSWSVGRDGELHAQWTRRTGSFQRVEYADALAVLQGPDRNFFRDKIVVVGDFSGPDRHASPLGQIEGPEFNAQLVNTLLAQVSTGPRRWSIPANAAWAALLALAAALAVRFPNTWGAGAAVAGVLAIATLAPGVASVTGGIWIDTIGPLLAVGGALLLATFWEAAHSGRLARRFTPDHVREGRPDRQTENATVMFIDVQGSTAMSARLGPERSRDLMRELLLRLSEEVSVQGGSVERTLGDGLMAVFRGEAPIAHPLRCVAAVAPLREAAAAISNRFGQELGVVVGVTIGMETGTVSGAVIRHATWEEWSSFGPTVNLAARIQGACGTTARPVLLGPACREAVKHQYATELVGQVELKGVPGPITLYAFLLSCPQADVISS